MNIFWTNINTYKVSLVPDVICIHPEKISLVCKNGKVVVVAFVDDKMHLSCNCAILRVVQQIYSLKGNIYIYLSSRFITVREHLKLAAQHLQMSLIQNLCRYAILCALLMHYLNVVRTDDKTHRRTHIKGVIVLNNKLIAGI